MKRGLIIVAGSLAAVSVALAALGYHGRREFRGESGPEVDPGVIVANARVLLGTPYDPLMGRFGDIGSKLGFIVCSDVPNIAYGVSGVSLRQLLADDYQRDSSRYDATGGNTPTNPYFHRRARNLYAYFLAPGALEPAASQPRVGDLAFYRRPSHKHVSHVALVTRANGAGYSLLEAAPETLFAREVAGSSPIERGWLLLGFGHLERQRP